MGTIVYRATKGQAVHDELASVGVYSNVLAHRVIGNRLWFLAQTHSGAHVDRKWIGLTLIDCRNGQAAIKCMDETCGPCYYDCPLAFLAQADAPTGPYAGPWREKVRAFHVNRGDACAPNGSVDRCASQGRLQNKNCAKPRGEPEILIRNERA